MINSGIGYIICESWSDPNPVTLKKESVTGKVIAQGCLQTADEQNRNGRWYSKEELFPQLKAPRTLELLQAGYLRAELGHPLSKDLQRQSVIDDTKTCAQFLSLWTEGDDVMATFRGTNNEYGNTFNLDLLDGCLPAWSLRALGTVHRTNRGAEVRDLRLITWDQVIYPSHPHAYTKGIISESASLLEDNDIYAENSVVIPVSDEDVLGFIKEESANIKFVRECFDFRYNSIVVNKEGTNVILTTNDGEVIGINMESYVHNELMKYASQCEALRS